MKIKELKQKSEKELKSLLIEYRKKLFDLTSILSQGQVKDVSQVRKIKKNVARIFTIIREKSEQKESRES